MILSFFGATLSEDQLDTEIRSACLEPADWEADPAGVAFALNIDRAPDPIPFDIGANAYSSSDEAYGKIIKSLAEKAAPCIPLVYAGAHWILIESVRASKKDDSYVLFGFTVVDPYPSEPARRFIPSPAFDKKYFQANEFGQIWASKYVVVADPSEPARASLATTADLEVVPSTPLRRLVRGMRDAFASLSPDLRRRVRATSAVTLLSQYSFTNVRPIRGGAFPSRETLVNDMSGDTYYIVLVDGNDNAYFRGVTAVAIDVVSDELLEATSDIDTFLKLDTTISAAADLKFGTDNYAAESEYFWSESPYSSSRFSPFRIITSSGTRYFAFANGVIIPEMPLRSAKGGN